MLRHVIAPARNYSQVPNEILRHPRLNSDAVRLLTWQLSLHPDDRQSLSKTAERAGIKKRAFQRAKKQLLDEGFLHEWRQQGERGHWLTLQLVSNLSLSPAEALAARDGLPPADKKPQAPPSAPVRATGRPTRRAVGRQPRKDVGDNTTEPPPSPEAVDLLLGLARTEPALAMNRGKARKWASLLVPWLEGGLAHEQIHHVLTQGIRETRNPIGVLLWRLAHARPEIAAPAAQPPSRLAGMRECEGRHTQPRLCLPVPGAARALCPECRTEPAVTTPGNGTGYATFRAARQAALA